MILSNILEDINDRKLRFRDGRDNIIIFWNNPKPRPKFLVVLGSHIEHGEVIFSAYVKNNQTYKVTAANAETLIVDDRFHFHEDELDSMVKDLENSEVIGDILSNNLVESAIELEEFKTEYYLA